MLQESFLCDGFIVVPEIYSTATCADFAAQVALTDHSSAGTRSLLSWEWCAAIVDDLRQHPHLSPLIPPDFAAVQCTYFEKSQSRNWLVSIHQDLSIPVAHRVAHPELQGWSEKEGSLFVQAPEALLSQMLAVRLHLDPCQPEDGALRVIPRSHLLGRISPEAAAQLRKSSEEVICAVEQGGVLVMRPLLLHASSKSTGQGLRRVLHFLFAPQNILYGLQWQQAV